VLGGWLFCLVRWFFLFFWLYMCFFLLGVPTVTTNQGRTHAPPRRSPAAPAHGRPHPETTPRERPRGQKKPPHPPPPANPPPSRLILCLVVVSFFFFFEVFVVVLLCVSFFLGIARFFAISCFLRKRALSCDRFLRSREKKGVSGNRSYDCS